MRAELAAIEPARGCDRLAELSALLHTAGVLHWRGHGEIALHLDLGSSAVARRAFGLVRARGVRSQVRTYEQRAFDRPTRYQLHVEGDDGARRLLVDTGVVSTRGRPLPRPPRHLVGRRCCRGAYLRGALLGAGSVSGPRSPHLEIRFAELEGAEHLASVVSIDGVQLRTRDRGRFALAYARGAEAIADALALAGASEAALAIDEHAVVAAARADANRLANADHANLVRSTLAAHEQLRAVRALAEQGSLAALPPALQEIAELRLRYPAFSLRELAAKCRPPTTRAAAHRRLAKLVALAGR